MLHLSSSTRGARKEAQAEKMDEQEGSSAATVRVPPLSPPAAKGAAEVETVPQPDLGPLGVGLGGVSGLTAEESDKDSSRQQLLMEGQGNAVQVDIGLTPC